MGKHEADTEAAAYGLIEYLSIVAFEDDVLRIDRCQYPFVNWRRRIQLIGTDEAVAAQSRNRGRMAMVRQEIDVGVQRQAIGPQWNN